MAISNNQVKNGDVWVRDETRAIYEVSKLAHKTFDTLANFEDEQQRDFVTVFLRWLEERPYLKPQS